MNFYIFVLKHPNYKDKPCNYAFWFGIERNLKTARRKAVKNSPGCKIITWNETKLWKMIYTLPFFNILLYR